MQNSLAAWVSALFATLLIMSAISRADGLPPLTHRLTPLKKPMLVPALQLKDLDGETVDIKRLRGKTLVVNFWATWCPPCRREMGSIERLYQATRGKNIEVLAVNVGEDVDTVFSFLGTVEPSPGFPILLDPDAETLERWKVKGLPTTYVIDPIGKVIYRAVGGREFDHPDIVKAILGLDDWP